MINETDTDALTPIVRAPRVSVVTCFHNRRAFVQASMDSLLKQKYSDFEIIVVDDLSNDGTGEYLQGLDDPRLTVVHNDTNRGFVRSLVSAIGMARGEFIAIHGAGDLSFEDRLARQVDFLDSHQDYVAVGCHREVLAPDGMVVSRTRPGPEPITHDRLVDGNVFSHGEVMYRRTAYEASGGYRVHMQYAQDYDLWLRMSKLGLLGVVQHSLYGRMAHEDGVSFNPEKVARQASFSELARAIAIGEIPDEQAALDLVAKSGVHAVMPISNPRVARKLRDRVRVLVSIGRWEQARTLAFDLLEPGWANPIEVAAVRLACAVGSLVDPKGQLTRRLLASLRA